LKKDAQTGRKTAQRATGLVANEAKLRKALKKVLSKGKGHVLDFAKKRAYPLAEGKKGM
jgi:hypothetical protein